MRHRSHYHLTPSADAYIIGCSLVAFLILACFGNIPTVDAFFFAVSGCTESGLNTVDLKDLKWAQQFVVYMFPIVTNLATVNILVVVIRIWYFEKSFREISELPSFPSHIIMHMAHQRPGPLVLKERRTPTVHSDDVRRHLPLQHGSQILSAQSEMQVTSGAGLQDKIRITKASTLEGSEEGGHIIWAEDLKQDKVLRIPPPIARDEGMSVPSCTRQVFAAETSTGAEFDLVRTNSDEIAVDDGTTVPYLSRSRQSLENSGDKPSERRRSTSRKVLDAVQQTVSPTGVLENAFVLGDRPGPQRSSTLSKSQDGLALTNLPQLSASVTVGKNSNFTGMNAQDRERLGGVEYRSLKLLLKIIVGLYAGLHIFGYVSLTPWILHSNTKYREYLATQGANPVWWAFYSVETMVSNCGFTLTADSMVSFRDASWPMVLLTFLAFAGNTCHPIILRFVIWTFHKLAPKTSSMQESLRFLLDHPRRCYTILFPGNATWVLFGILFALNFIDVLLIVVLDLENPEVASLPMAARLNAATFQAASARHTGTSTFNLAKVNPAVQFSLLVMMYIAIYPIAMSIRGSNTYEDTALGKYANNDDPQDNQPITSYLMQHIRNQLSFDLWYIFLGTFCLCIAESSRIMDPDNAAFNVFAIMFECVSAYGNVGLSLGTDSTLTSLSGDMTPFGKVVICAMMWRGRHRGLPYALDHAVMLPSQDLIGGRDSEATTEPVLSDKQPLTRSKTI